MLGLVCSDLMIFFSELHHNSILGDGQSLDERCFVFYSRFGINKYSINNITDTQGDGYDDDRWVSITFPSEYGIFKQKPGQPGET